MVNNLKLVLPAMMLLLANQVYAQSSNSTSTDTSNADACAAVPLEDYHIGLRVGSIFIILITTALGTFGPMILHRIKPYQQGDIRDWVLTVGKFFGTGVILATAFVHMLPDALSNFSSPCLTGGWTSYGAFAGIFCMIASFALQLLEVVSVAHMNKLRKLKQKSTEPELGNVEYNEKNTADQYSDEITAKDTQSHSHIHNNEDHHIGDGHNHAHAHGAAFLETDDAYKHLGTYILELGIVMHSILIGIALSNTGNDEFTTLLIALVFHQFFEGIALGTRLNEVDYKSWVQPALMGLVYTLMTPIGIAIGIGIHASFNPNSQSAILSAAILDSLSAGILLYNAYVSLMSAEISHSAAFHNSSTGRKIVCFISMYIGAGIMSLIGEWA